MTKKNDEGLSIGIWNLFQDKIENLKVKINVDFNDVKFVNCKGHIEGSYAVVDTIIYPYEFAGVEVKR